LKPGVRRRFKRGGHVSNLSKTTHDHNEIRKWAEARGGKPTHAKGTGGAHDLGILRIDFPGYSGEGKLEPISWEEFFEKFDEQELALVYQEKTADGQKKQFQQDCEPLHGGGEGDQFRQAFEIRTQNHTQP
jgi:hypothetical protein